MALLGWLETTGLSVWIREGETIWAFPTIITLHTFGLGLLVGASVVLDLRLLGVAPRLPLAPLRSLFGLMWGGLGLNAVTGLMLFAADATKRGPSGLYWTKLAFVALGVWTIVKIKRTVFDGPGDPATGGGSPKLLAGLSLLAWTTAVTLGRLLAYV